MARPLHAVGAAAPDQQCRVAGCWFPRSHATGYCDLCQRCSELAGALRESLLARAGARLPVRLRRIADALDPADRDRLLAHLAARTAHHRRAIDPDGAVPLAGLDDFLAELYELGLAPEELMRR